MKPEELAGLLTGRSQAPARLTAPASGLFLERVLYEDDEELGPMPLRAITPVRSP
jgi:hypothetical protein